jgi:hypothetical protein
MERYRAKPKKEVDLLKLSQLFPDRPRESDALAPLAANPLGETLTGFRRRADAHYRARAGVLRDHGYVPRSPRPFVKQHCRWFVTHRVLRRSQRVIADEFPAIVSEASIQEACQRISEDLHFRRPTNA